MDENKVTEAEIMPQIMKDETANAIVKAYNDAVYVDNTAVVSAKFSRLTGFQVTGDEENIAAAKKTRAALNGLVKDVSAGRMAVQRAIKTHPIGVFAFGKSELEKAIEKESKRLDNDIKHAENAPKIQLNEKVETFVCFITGTLSQINKLAVYVNDEMGLNFENRGPVCEDGVNGKSIDETVKAEAATDSPSTPPPPPPEQPDEKPIF